MGGKGGISGREIQYNAEISRAVEQLRTHRRISRAELARAAGVSSPMYYSYEIGVSRWPAFRLRLIADYLKVSVDEIIPKTKSYVKSPAAQQKLL